MTALRMRARDFLGEDELHVRTARAERRIPPSLSARTSATTPARRKAIRRGWLTVITWFECETKSVSTDGPKRRDVPVARGDCRRRKAIGGKHVTAKADGLDLGAPALCQTQTCKNITRTGERDYIQVNPRSMILARKTQKTTRTGDVFVGLRLLR